MVSAEIGLPPTTKYEVGAEVKVVVSSLQSETIKNFYVRPTKYDKSFAMVQNWSQDAACHYLKNGPTLPFDDLVVGTTCLSMNLQDEQWYRSRVSKISKEKDKIELLQFDTGEERVLSKTDVANILFEMKTSKKLLTFCPMAMKVLWPAKNPKIGTTQLVELLDNKTEILIKILKVTHNSDGESHYHISIPEFEADMANNSTADLAVAEKLEVVNTDPASELGNKTSMASTSSQGESLTADNFGNGISVCALSASEPHDSFTVDNSPADPAVAAELEVVNTDLASKLGNVTSMALTSSSQCESLTADNFGNGISVCAVQPASEPHDSVDSFTVDNSTADPAVAEELEVVNTDLASELGNGNVTSMALTSTQCENLTAEDNFGNGISGCAVLSANEPHDSVDSFIVDNSNADPAVAEELEVVNTDPASELGNVNSMTSTASQCETLTADNFGNGNGEPSTMANMSTEKFVDELLNGIKPVLYGFVDQLIERLKK